MKIKILCGFIVLTGLLSGCTQIQSYTPPYSSCTFTIPAPSNYDCYLNKGGTGRKIMLSINLITKHPNPNNTGPNVIEISDKTITFDPTVTTFPVTIDADIPNDPDRPSFPWTAEVIIEGTECSTCASGWSLPNETPNGACFDNLIPGSNPARYQAAKPRWAGGKTGNSYVSTITTLVPWRVSNVPNSCTCTVTF